MRPEDFERFRKEIRRIEKMLRSINVDIEQVQKQARDLERMGPSPEQEERIVRETEMMRELLSDPQILQAYADATQFAAQHNAVLAQMPDASTQRALLESARYFSSREFESQRDAILQANQIARQKLGPQGLGAAMRIAARDAAAAGRLEQAAERIRGGQVTRILEEASELAASPEVRELLERADLEALVRVDEEEQSELPAPDTEVTGRPEVYEDEYPEDTEEALQEQYKRALLVLLPLKVALAIQLASPGAQPVVSSLSETVDCLITVVAWLQLMTTRSKD